MNKVSLTVLLTIFLSLNIFAQKEKNSTLDDFSGTWILNEDRSFKDLVIKENFEDFTLVISRQESEIKISRSYLFKGQKHDYTITLWTDKRGEDNAFTLIRNLADDNTSPIYRLEDITVKSKSHFKNGKIIRNGNYKRDNDKYPVIVKETYSLSEDNKVLTILTERTLLTTANSFEGIRDRAMKERARIYKEVFLRN